MAHYPTVVFRNGWVAFDSTPRPELDVFTQGNLAPFASSAFIFQTRVGGGLYRYIQAGASEVTERIAEAIEDQAGSFVGAVAAIAVLVLVSAAAWLLYRRLRRRPDAHRYSRLTGEGRADVLRTYRNLERLLQRNGLGRRGASQSLGEYAEIVRSRVGRLEPEIEWLTRAAWAAAYDPDWLGPRIADQARRLLDQLRRSPRSPFQA